jgi:hypothetical protein
MTGSYEETIVAHAIKILARRIPKGGKVDGKYLLSSDTGITREYHLTIKDITGEEAKDV